MYVPRRHEVKDPEVILDFIRHHSFGILVTARENLPTATHIPFHATLDAEKRIVLESHISKGNSQKQHLAQGDPVMVIFHGPHAYISPRWYTELNVPTWNYQTIHVYGTVELLEGEELKSSLDRFVDTYESHMPHPMKMHEIPHKTFQDDFRGIIGFRIRSHEIHAAFKLSQNRDETSYSNVIEQLKRQPDTPAQEISEAMSQIREQLFREK